MKKALLIALAGVLVVGAAAYFVVRAFMGPIEDEAVALVPDNAAIYVNAFLNPSGNQKRALRDLLEHFEKIESPDRAGDLIADLVDEALQDTGATYEKDVKPWLGRQAAFFLSDLSPTEPEAAALIATEDRDATQAFVDKLQQSDAADGSDLEQKSYAGVDYTFDPIEQSATGFVGDFFVVGSESGFEAVVDTSMGEQPSLGESERYLDTIDPLDDDHLGLAFFDPETILDAAAAAGEVGDEELEALRSIPGLETLPPTALVLSVTDSSLSLESASRRPEDERGAALLGAVGGSGLLREMPADAWFALAASDVGSSLETLVDSIAQLEVPGADLAAAEQQFEAQTGLDLRADVISWMGDAGLFVQGDGLLSLGGALVIESLDPDTSARTIETVGNLLAGQGVPVTPSEREGYRGFEIRLPGVPQPVGVLAGDKVVIGFGAKAMDDAISADETLEESDAFRRSADDLGDGFDASFFLNMDAVQTLAESFVPSGEETYEDDVEPWLGPLSHITAGTRVDGDIIIQKLVIGVE